MKGVIKLEITLNNENFNREVLNSGKAVLVDFWAPWCGPCRMLAPHLEKIADEFEDKLTVGKVNADEVPELCLQYRIVSIPALYLFKDGEVKAKTIGYMEEEELRAFVEQFL